MNELGSGRTLWVRPRRRGVFRLSVGRGRPAVRRHVGRTRTPAGQIFSPVCRVGRPSPRGVFLRGAILSPSRRVGRPSPRGVFLRGAILSPSRRVGRLSPRRAFLRGTNSFARAPCREAFAEGRVPARGKSLRLRAVSGGLRRGERSCAGQILSPVRRVGRPSPRGAFLRGANPFARAPCREAFAEGRVSAWANPAHHPAPSENRGAVRVDTRAGWTQRGANPFARVPCREAFAE